MASAAPWISRAVNSHGSERPNAKSTDAAASAIMPPTSGARRPVRSDIAPIGMETVSSVTPNDANSNPIVVGDAPSRRLRSGNTGTAIEWARMSVKVAKVTKATAIARELRNDMFVNGTSRGHEITKHENTKTRKHGTTNTRKHEKENLCTENFQRIFVLSCFPAFVCS